jgi:hypothetical protein
VPAIPLKIKVLVYALPLNTYQFRPLFLPVLPAMPDSQLQKRTLPIPNDFETHQPGAILMKLDLLSIALGSVLLPGLVAAQQPSTPTQDKSQPADSSNSMHDAHAHMNERGDKGMGFSQTATTHHFYLKPDGGVIQVEANDSKDTATRDSIRAHLTHVAHAFSSGDFDIPMFVHDTVPPGVPELKRMKDKITYAFEKSPNGGRVMIHTSDPAALDAIRKYLRFQIEEHRTKDPTTVQ